MKLDYRLFPVTIVVLFIIYMFFNKTIEQMENTTPLPPSKASGPLACGTTPSSEAEIKAAFGESAREACRIISSRADEIEAAYGGMSEITKNIPILGWTNPNNWRAGDATVTDEGRRIINTNLSSCEITNIQQITEQMASSLQQNIIDNTKCIYCNPPTPELAKYIIDAVGAPNCSVSGVKQINVSEIQQKAVLNALISTLLNKKASLDAQAFAKVLQKTESILSGDTTYERKSCDLVDTDMSTTQYFDQISSCVQNASNIQENIINFCGNIGDVVQQNQSKMLQTCLGDVKKEVTQNVDVTQDISRRDDISQESTGLSTAAIIAIIAGIIIFCCLSSSGYLFFKKQVATAAL